MLSKHHSTLREKKISQLQEKLQARRKGMCVASDNGGSYCGLSVYVQSVRGCSQRLRSRQEDRLVHHM